MTNWNAIRPFYIYYVYLCILVGLCVWHWHITIFLIYWTCLYLILYVINKTDLSLDAFYSVVSNTLKASLLSLYLRFVVIVVIDIDFIWRNNSTENLLKFHVNIKCILFDDGMFFVYLFRFGSWLSINSISFAFNYCSMASSQHIDIKPTKHSIIVELSMLACITAIFIYDSVSYRNLGIKNDETSIIYYKNHNYWLIVSI